MDDLDWSLRLALIAYGHAEVSGPVEVTGACSPYVPLPAVVTKPREAGTPWKAGISPRPRGLSDSPEDPLPRPRGAGRICAHCFLDVCSDPLPPVSKGCGGTALLEAWWVKTITEQVTLETEKFSRKARLYPPKLDAEDSQDLPGRSLRSKHGSRGSGPCQVLGAHPRCSGPPLAGYSTPQILSCKSDVRMPWEEHVSTQPEAQQCQEVARVGPNSCTCPCAPISVPLPPAGQGSLLAGLSDAWPIREASCYLQGGSPAQ